MIDEFGRRVMIDFFFIHESCLAFSGTEVDSLSVDSIGLKRHGVDQKRRKKKKKKGSCLSLIGRNYAFQMSVFCYITYIVWQIVQKKKAVDGHHS